MMAYSFSEFTLPSPITVLKDPLFESFDLQFLIKRDDLIHPLVAGNKWRKLKYNAVRILERGAKSITSMGGPYSNHLVAVAVVGNLMNRKTTGFIRSYQTHLTNPTIELLSSLKMDIEYLRPDEYDELMKKMTNQSSNDFAKDAYFIPQGGTNKWALDGVGEIVNELGEQDVFPQYIVTALGTAGTYAGLKHITKANTTVLGISPFKGQTNKLEGFKYLQSINTESIIPCGDHLRFGAVKEEIARYINSFFEAFGVLLDPVYTARAMRKTMELIKNGYFKKGSTVVFLHSGGLQGIMGYNQQLKTEKIHLPFKLQNPTYPWFEGQS